MANIKELTGKRFGKLIVLSFYKRIKNQTMWICKCDCGTIKIINGSNLTRNITSSCGCYGKEQRIKSLTIHGLTNHKLYSVYSSIKQRCYDKNSHKYKNYGGRGITICDEWRNDFKKFYDWAINNGYKEEKLPNGINNLTIGRIDNDSNYCPENCRWETNKQQMNNMTTSHFITYKGKTKTMKQWCENLNLKYLTIAQRINCGNWSIERAFETPIRKKSKIKKLYE